MLPPKHDGVDAGGIDPIYSNDAPVGLDQTIEAAEERRLSGPTLADQRDRRALRHVERNVDESYDVTERFAEVLRDERGGHRVCAATDSSASLRDAHMGSATHSLKVWPPQIVLADCTTCCRTTSGYLWQFGVLLPVTQPL